MDPPDKPIDPVPGDTEQTKDTLDREYLFIGRKIIAFIV
jgi:hypothetical protein